MYITTQLSFHEILLAPDREEVKRKRESQFSWELRGTKEEGSIKYCTWRNKWMRERMKDFSVPFSTSILASLVFRPLQWTVEIKCICEEPRRGSSRSRDSSSKSWTNAIKHSAGTADAPTVPAFYPSPSSTETLKNRRKSPDFGACETYTHILSLPLTISWATTGLSWRSNKITC